MHSIFPFFQVVEHEKLLHFIEVGGLEPSRSHTLPLSVISNKSGILIQCNRSAATGFMCGSRMLLILTVEGETSPSKLPIHIDSK